MQFVDDTPQALDTTWLGFDQLKLITVVDSNVCVCQLEQCFVNDRMAQISTEQSHVAVTISKSLSGGQL